MQLGTEDGPARFDHDREALYRRIFDSVSDGIVVLDTAGAVIECNRSAESILGYEAEELAGLSLADERWRPVRPDGSSLASADHPGSVTARTGRSCEDVIIGVHHPDGTLRWISVTTEPLSSGTSEADLGAGRKAMAEPSPTDIPSVVCTLADVTERLEVERLKSEFVSIVSHELRTPLTSLRASLSLLANSAGDNLSPQQNRMVELATNNAQRLGRLIDDILDIERVESGQASLSLRQANSADIVQQSINAMQGMADDADVGLEAQVDSPCWLWVDPDRIVQTLTNLISNAIKFSPAGSTITVSTDHAGAEATFGVADQGRGIPKELMESIFDRFQQVDASDSREKGGTGLGLAICKSIAAQHGGEIVVRSVVGEGSVFTLSLPALASLGSSTEGADVAGPTVLVCDVDPDSGMVLRSLFTDAGCRVLMVDTIEDAVKLATEDGPDALLLDLGEKSESGSEAIGTLTAAPAVAEIPLVMIVRREQSEDGIEFSVRGRRIHPQALVKRIVDLLAQTAGDPNI